MIIRDLFCLHIIFNDLYGCFFVTKVKYFEVLTWLFGIYAPNNANQRIEWWSSMYPRFAMGPVGLLMGDFNVC